MIDGIYDPWLVALSLGIAIFTSGMALHTAAIAERLQEKLPRQLALGAGTLTLAGGIWAMHFIGMLAFDLCTPVRYDLRQTAWSMIPALLASWMALRMLARSQIARRQLVLSGMLIGGGIGAMHYSGMAAMRMTPLLRYDATWFSLSILVCVALATLSLWIQFRLRSVFPSSPQGLFRITSLSGIVMGLSIASMHYMGMVAARFVAPPDFSPANSPLDTGDVALKISLASVLIAILTTVISHALLRFRQLYQQMRANESKYRSLLLHIPGLAYRRELDAKRSLVFVSEGSLALTGWSAEEFLSGQHDFRHQIHPDDQALVLGLVNRALVEQQAYETEFRLIHRDGGLRWILARGGLIFDDAGKPCWFDGLLTDITEQKTAQQALRASETQMTSLTRNIPGVVLRSLIDSTWTVQYISDVFETMSGWTAAQLLSGEKNLVELTHADDVPQFLNTLKQAVAEHRSYDYEYRLLHRDGHYIWVWARGSATYDAKGNAIWMDSILMDIQARHEMEDELRQSKNRAEAAALSKTTFLANMSHEIRTPMNAIIGFTELLLGTDLSTQQRSHMNTVRQSARSLLGLLNDILDTAKLEKGALELESKDFSLKTLVIQVVEVLQLSATNKGLALRVIYDPHLDEFFLGDALRLRQILTNLLGNAIKFTVKGAVELKVTKAGERVHFAVCDTGIGIAADRLDKIFAPFSQADASMSRRFGGSGLGTTIARQLVELMGGEIRVESTPGQGSTFHVVLPLQPGQPVEIIPDVILYDLPVLRILAVDDVAQNLELLALALGGRGHEVMTASDGQEALNIYQEQHFDVILMDVQMPGMDGLEATRRIRRLEQEHQRHATPVVALTASVMEEDRRATNSAGMNGFASKPIDLAQLMNEIARVMGLPLAATSGIRKIAAIAPIATLPVIDWANGITLWGNQETLAQAIRRFLNEHSELEHTLKKLLHHHEHNDACHLAHLVRGAAGNLYLPQLQAGAMALENALKASPDDSTQQALQSVTLALHDIRQELAAIAPEPENQSNPVPAAQCSNQPDCTKWAHSALQAALHNQLDDESINNLGAALRTDGHSQWALELETAFAVFDFNKAQELLKSLILWLDPQTPCETP